MPKEFKRKFLINGELKALQDACRSEIGLITVVGAILTGRQSGQKLQYLYENLMANNYFQNRIFRNL